VKLGEKTIAEGCEPFPTAKIRHFDASEIDAAKAWLAET
jgi:hypothetical protein